MGIPRELVRAVKNKRIVPFIGAGVSMGVKRDLFPSWKDLVERLATLIAEDPDGEPVAERVRHLRDGGDYPQAAEVAFQKLGAFRFNRELRAALRVAQPSDGNLSVPQGVWALRPPLVITTNYDEVLRWAGPPGVSVVANDQAEELALLDDDKSSDSPWLWHLHGTIQRLGTVILAGAGYRQLYGDDGSTRARDYEGALFRLRSAMVSLPLLYIGFSLSDPYVLQEIKYVLDLTDRKGPPSYALMKKGQGDAGALWSNYNIQLVEYADHGPPLAALLQEIALQAFPPPAPPAPPPDATFRSAWGPPSFTAADEEAEELPMRSVAARSIRKEARLPNPASVDFPGHGADDVPSPEAGAAPSPEAGDVPSPEARAAPSLEAIELPVPEPAAPAPVPRPALEDAYASALRENRRLLVLGPRRGGARTLVRSLAERHFGQRVTKLSPPNVPGCTAREYVQALSGEKGLDGFPALETWLHGRARAAGGEHLIVLNDDGGPVDHLTTLGISLRKLLDEGRSPFFAIVAGGAPCARLHRETTASSLFSGAPVRHVPPLGVAEVGAALKGAGLDAGKAGEVHRAIGGLPGLLNEVLAGGTLDPKALTARLAESPAVRGVLRLRLSEDDRLGVEPKRHARWALQEMLAGRAVEKLADVEDQLEHAEARLYYDGLVVAEDGARGATVFRCEAVRLAAAQALR
jgi:hypothetical protein